MSEQNQELEKNTIIFAKSASVGEDSKGRQKIDVRLDEETTKLLKEELSKTTKAKIQLHLGEGQYGPSAFMFVKEVQERQSGGGGSFKKPSASSAVKSKIEGLKKG
jgi:hypothetical protein